MRLTSAGNVIIPAIKTIGELGYKFRIDNVENLCIAEKDGNTFIAEDPIAVLGLIKMYEVKGNQWQVSDEEITALGREYNLI
jgi:hypothetical protein